MGTMHHLLAVLLIGLLLSTYWAAREFCRQTVGFRKSEWALGLLLFGVALALRLVFVDPTLLHTNFHGLYFLDIPLSQRVAGGALLAEKAGYGLTNYTFYHLLWAYLPRTLGVYYFVNAILSSGCACLTYLLVRVLGGRVLWALCAGLTLAILPAHAGVSLSENDIILSSFFCLAGLAAWIAFLRFNSKVLFFWSLACLVVAVHSRVLVLSAPPVYVMAWWLHRPGAKASFRSPWAIAGLLATVASCLPQYVHICALLQSQATTGASAASLVQLPLSFFTPSHNLLLNWQFVPTVVPAGVAVSVWLCATSRSPGRDTLLGATLVWGLLYLYFSNHPLDALRYQFFVWPFYSALATAFLDFMPQRSTFWRGQAPAAVAVAWLILATATSVPFLGRPEAARAISEELRFIRETLPQLADTSPLAVNDSIVVEGRPPIRAVLIPDFLLAEAGLGGGAHGPKVLVFGPDSRLPEGPLLLYVGLQAHARYDHEPLDPLSPRISPPALLERYKWTPIKEHKMDVSAQSPGPSLLYGNSNVTIGFYLLVPAS